METENFVNGNTTEEIWQQIRLQFQQQPDVFTYHTTITQGGHSIILDIDIDLGGGFESGFSTTSFTSVLSKEPPFRFAIHEEHFTDEIGKFFGMQDVVIGYKEFDEKLIVKTNDKAAVRKLFSLQQTRDTIISLEDFTFGIHHHSNDGTEQAYLELYIEDGVTDVEMLQAIYTAFFAVLEMIEG